MLTTRPLASTTFIAGPEDDLATPDVYEIKTDSVINKFPGVPTIDDSNSFGDALRGGKSLLGKLPDIASINVAGVTDAVKSNSLLDKVKDFGSSMAKAVGGVAGIKAIASVAGPSLLSRVSSGTLSGIPGLNGVALGSLSSTLLNSAMPDQVKQLFNSPIAASLGTFNSANGVLSKIAPGNIAQSFQMGSLINNVTGTQTTNIVDKDGASRLIAGLAMGGVSSGMPNSFSALAPLAGNDQQILINAGMAVARYASGTGNITSLKDVVTAVGPQNLAAGAASLIKSFSTNYKPSNDKPQAVTERKNDYRDISDTLDIIDPSWMREDRYKIDVDTQLPVMDFPVVDAALVCEGSNDFAATMRAGAISDTNTDAQFMALATMFPTRSPEMELANNFPLTVTSVSSNTVSNNNTLYADLADIG